jgi:hypothetical protein
LHIIKTTTASTQKYAKKGIRAAFKRCNANMQDSTQPKCECGCPEITLNPLIILIVSARLKRAIF